MRFKSGFLHILLLAVLTSTLPSWAWPQQSSNFNRDIADQMLKQVTDEVAKRYYDPKLHGVEWAAKVEEEKRKISQESSWGMSLSHIAAALDVLNDSHTFFLPPSRASRLDYGWQMQMVGNRCFVMRVRPGSDAESKQLKPGDEVELLNGYAPTRDNLWKMTYVNKVLRPQAELRVLLRDPEGRERQVDVMAKVVETKRVMDLTGQEGATDIWDLIRESENEEEMMRPRYVEVSDEVMILKIPEFFFDMEEVDGLIGKARKHKSLILDLRGDPGGAVGSLKDLISKFFDKDIQIADRVGRKKYKPEIAKSKGHDSFEGKLVVLMDSRSASASELFARVVQLEKRGVVMGDRSSGSVMEAKRYNFHAGMDTVMFYGASITESDLIMADGKSLEHVGVTPDEEMIPTPADMAAGRDPVLAHAAETLGAKLTPEEAGKLFPYKWPIIK